MKTKLLAIVLAMLMLVQPVMAIGMVGMESAEEIAAAIPEQVQEEEIQEAEVMTTASDVLPDNVIFFDDFEANEVKELNTVGNTASYTPAYQKGETTVKLGTTDRSTATVDGVDYPSNPHWQIIDENGDKVLHITQYTGQHNNAGFDFNNLKFYEPGVYTLSFDLKLELGENAETFGLPSRPTPVTDFCWFHHEKKDAAGNTTSVGPTNSGINKTNGTAMTGNWKTVSYKYVVKANDDGTRTIEPVISNMNGYRNSNGYHVYAEGEYLSRIRHYFYMEPAGKSQAKFYIDDVKLTYDAAVTVTYKNEKGATLATSTVHEGDVITVAKSLANVQYPVIFTVDGVDYNEGANFTVPYGNANIVITVKNAIAIPEHAPSWSVFYEDFEAYAGVDSSVANKSNLVSYATEEYGNVKMAPYSGSGSYTVDPEDPDNIVYKNMAKSMYNGGFRIDFPSRISEVGEYTLSYKLYVSPSVPANFSRVNTFERLYFASNEVDGNYYAPSGTSYYSTNRWNYKTTTFKIYESDGKKYVSVNGAAGKELNPDFLKIIIHVENHNTVGWGNTDTTVDYFNLYYDDICLAYYPGTTTVKYVDEAGNHLFTEAAESRNYEFATKAELGTSYYPAFFIDGKQVNSNFYTLPNVSNITVTVKPNNVIFFDDYETYGVGHSFTKKHEQKVLTPAFVRDGSPERLQTGDNNDIDGVYTNSEAYVDQLSNGNKVYHIIGNRARHNSVGLKWRYLDVSKPGRYTLSLKASLLRGAGNTWTQTNDAGFPGANATIAVTKNELDMKLIEYTIIATDNGDGTMKYITTNNTNSNKPERSVSGKTNAMLAIYFNAEGSSSTPTGVAEVLIDEAKWAYSAPVKVTYVDKNGETIATADMYETDTITLKHSNVGYTFATQFEIDGVKYDDGDTYIIPIGKTAVTIKAERYSWNERPAEAPVNAVLYEDFSKTGALSTVFSPITWYDDTFFTNTMPKFASYNGAHSYDVFDGKNVIKITNAPFRYHGINLSNIKLTKPGKYTINYHAYIDTPNGVEIDDKGVYKYESTLNWYDPVGSSAGTPVLWGTGSSFGTSGRKHGQWNDFASSIKITEQDGKLYNLSEDGKNKYEIENVERALWYLNWSFTNDTHKDYPSTVYISSMSFVYNEEVTVKILDINGAVINTFNVYQNDTITLPDLKKTIFTYGTTTYNPGETFKVPADAQDEITITAARLPMPNTVPANTVVYEDFEDKTVGQTVSAKAPNYVVEAFDGTTVNQCEGDTASKTYEKTPDGTSTALKIVSTGTYSNSMQVDLPDDIEVGRYNVSWRFYIDNDKKVEGKDEYLNSIAGWCRVWYGSQVKDANGKEIDDGFVGASTNIQFNKPENRKAWNTYSFDFEIFEEGGKKYAKMFDESHVITGDVYLKLHTTSSNASAENSNTIYHDDLIITQVKPTTYTATFVDENGESFEFVDSYLGYDNSYKLPTAAEMGIDYLVEFVGADGKTYYPNTFYTFEGSPELEFVVKKSDVIFYEDYEGLTKTSGWLTPTYAVGPFAEAKVWGNRINNNVNGTKSNVVTTAGTAIANTTPEFMNITLTQPGIYKFSMDVELKLEKKAETDLVDSGFYVNFQRISGWNNAGSNVYLREGELKKTLSAYVEIFEGEDGKMYHRLGSHTGTLYELTEVENGEASPKQYPINSFRTGLIWSTAFINSTEQRATYHMSFDNVKVEYTPFDPVNTGKASYRAEHEGGMGPEGIRFAAYVSNAQRELASEYGFLVTRKTLLGGDNTKLNLSGVQGEIKPDGNNAYVNGSGVVVIPAAAYIKDGGVDKIYVQDGEIFGLQGLYDTFFTAVLYGLDSDVRKSEVFVARPYAKVGGIYYYGECHETSYNKLLGLAEAANA